MKPAIKHYCTHCNKQIEVHEDTRMRQFCSNACRQAAYRFRNHLNAWYWPTCQQCDLTFESRSKASRYCSNACKQRAYRERTATSD